MVTYLLTCAAVILPGSFLIFLFDRDLFENLHIIKFLILASTYSLPLIALATAFFIITFAIHPPKDLANNMYALYILCAISLYTLIFFGASLYIAEDKIVTMSFEPYYALCGNIILLLLPPICIACFLLNRKLYSTTKIRWWRCLLGVFCIIVICIKYYHLLVYAAKLY